MSPTQSARRHLLWVTAFLSACLLVGTSFLAPAYAAGRDGPRDKAVATGAGESPEAPADAAEDNAAKHTAKPAKEPGKASSHETDGTAGTSGDVSEPQPRSKADQNGTGANQSGPYDSTRDGSPSLNGKGDGKATGKPCAGCVGKADNKNPKGQMPDGSDHNAGYECDRNQGIGKTNPAHTGCKTVEPPKEEPPVEEPPCVDNPKTQTDECDQVEPPCVDKPETPMNECEQVEPPAEEPPVVEPCVDAPETPMDECDQVEPPVEEPPVVEPCVDNPETTADECGEVAPPVGPNGGPQGGPEVPTAVTAPPATVAPAPAGEVAAGSSSPAASALPRTGLDAWLLGLLAMGLAALAGGAVLLRRAGS